MDSLSRFRTSRTTRIVLASVLAAVTLLIVCAAVFVSSASFRGMLVEWLAERTHHRIQVDGPFEVNFLSWTPRVVAERVTIGNPPWMPAGNTAEIERVALELDFPLPWRETSIRKLEMTGAKLHLIRDAASRTNWQTRPPGAPRGGPGHLIRSLRMPNAQVDLNDERRHIQFNGRVSAQDSRGSGGAPFLRIEGVGRINGRAGSFALNGDPLATMRRDRPYRFAFAERSGPARLTGRGALPRPFALDALDARFGMTGSSLNDTFFLVGMHLPNSAPIRMSGQLTRRGPRSTFSNLASHFGESDLGGTIVTETIGGRSHVNADLHAKSLRLADLGRHGPHGEPIRQPNARKLLLADVDLPLNVLNRRDAAIRFSADTFVMRAMTFNAFDATATIEKGVLKVPALSAAFRDSHVTGTVTVDARKDTPLTDADLRVAGLQLGQFFRKAAAQAPLEGLLQARVQIQGRGNSLHDVASSANGSVVAVLPSGSMRESLAELTGQNLRGLGLMLTARNSETPVRCALLSFKAREGVLNAEHLLIDTEPVLITGSGSINLESETFDLTLQGQPKKMRLVHVRSPLYVRGQILHPSFGMNKGRVLAQTGGAAALGIALTPLAAALALVDPGLAKDANCAALTAEGRASTH
jgi:uncharacterized protein involved in outer membrane biogenesis